MKKIPKQSTNPSNKYPFLTAYKEKEAVVMGLAPTGKYQQVLYNHIKKSSSNQSASTGSLVTIREMQIEKNKLKRNEVVDILNQLISVKLVVHVVSLEFDPYQRKLKTKSYFITHPPGEKQDTIYTVFEEVIEASVSAVKSWVELRDTIKTDIFKKFLEKQYSLSNAGDYYEFGGSILDIHKELKSKNFEVPCSEEMLEFTSSEIREHLIASKIAINLPDNLVLLIKESEILEHYEIASDFIEHKILPTLKIDPSFKQKIDKISVEETAYNVEKFVSRTGEFIAKKAREIKILKDPDGNNPNYPGSLAVDTVLNIDSQAEKIYKHNWKKECSKQINDFKDPLLHPGSKTDSLIKFVKQTDVLTYPKEVWQSLTTDEDLYYSQWEVPNMTIHAFVARDPRIFKLLVKEMERLPSSEAWKALALKTIIEENEEDLKTLFADKVFLMNYGSLLKNVYIDFMPWYYKILFSVFSFGIFQDHFFKKAKTKISEQQEALKKENEKKHKEEVQKIEFEKKEKLNSILKDNVSNSICEILDRAYFSENIIPELEYVKKFFPDLNEEKLKEHLQKGNFRIVDITTKDERHLEVVLYPVNNEWQRRKNRLVRILDKHSEVLSKDFLSDEERLMLLKVSKLKTYLDVGVASNEPKPPAKKKSGGTDPYIRLDRKIKKLDEQEKIKQMEGDEEES